MAPPTADPAAARASRSGPAWTWWVSLPRRALRVSRPLAFDLADGHYLSAFPAVAAWATPVAAAAGLAFGAFTLGYERAFSESLTLVLVGTLLGYLATHLGLVFVGAFALGDFLLGQRTWRMEGRFFEQGLLEEGLVAGILRIRLPMLAGYLVLAALVVLLPKLVRGLLSDLPGATSLPEAAAFVVAGLLSLILVFVGVRLWAEAAAVLVRPLYTWQDLRVDPAAVAPLQERGGWVVWTAVLTTLARIGAVAGVWRSPSLRRRLQGTERGLAEPTAETVSPWSDRVPSLARAVVAAATITLMLAGLVESVVVAALLFGEFVVLRLLAAGVIPPRLDAWRSLVARVPILARLAVALLVVETVRDLFASQDDRTFTRLAVYVLVSVAVVYLLVPGPPRPDGGPATGGPPR